MFGFFKKKKNKNNSEELKSIIAELLSVQVATHGKRLFSTLMTNKTAAGYVFGFHDCAVQQFGIYDPKNPNAATQFIEDSYQSLFGNQAGFASYSSAIGSQEDEAFAKGRLEGGTDLHEFLANKTPPLGLSRILLHE